MEKRGWLGRCERKTEILISLISGSPFQLPLDWRVKDSLEGNPVYVGNKRLSKKDG